ncbi:hypothetical protein CcaverHIS002_0208870 [Cutaneotrichosporon cavernicola]|uniref:Uncharacterized protein n=1 Tax=Cutaneotrichosporon cavernicola TaxID=279322 RepID=A0AA48L077_9TREE|nr:uncharacterized protein CcaverHIS019_0208880 [Cutaneotrichosporon cavernicola]BEI81727.1 hypothetical protein CcaverHIS002_0208870 [Cutaneotrichosporon cavernicola]BEI89526.1 hypothetical protein CcaverHIS019_0208880 [Cutaneotrichosporon cavernicola]BEI97299.1 hypothetical protein CcaverHIS631_0208880 [Cutaneotrichosporon cavernicola]BEJ05073.1 hypothetical protein CcaverHIS641_0208900 [Cutaneotrichosporon cavernicola]
MHIHNLPHQHIYFAHYLIQTPNTTTRGPSHPLNPSDRPVHARRSHLAPFLPPLFYPLLPLPFARLFSLARPAPTEPSLPTFSTPPN